MARKRKGIDPFNTAQTLVRVGKCDPAGAEALAANLSDAGYYLINPDHIQWMDIQNFHATLHTGQGVHEDAGGFFARAIKALLGFRPDPVETYRMAIERMLDEKHREELGPKQ